MNLPYHLRIACHVATLAIFLLPLQQANAQEVNKPLSTPQFIAPRTNISIPQANKVQANFHNIGAQAAIMAAVGSVNQPKLGYVGAALVGISTIMNNNNNDGQPATFTGADGSNFAAGG